MARSQKDVVLRKAMCSRLQKLAEKHLRISIVDLSIKLGYANSTVLRKAWNGDVFPDTERLAKLATIKTELNQVPNIHWLITGDGRPLIEPQKKQPSKKKELMKVVKSLSDAKADSLLSILADSE